MWELWKVGDCKEVFECILDEVIDVVIVYGMFDECCECICEYQECGIYIFVFLFMGVFFEKFMEMIWFFVLVC